MVISLFDFAKKGHIAIVDSYSGLYGYNKLASASSSGLIKILNKWFTTHEIPRTLQSDNEMCFTSAEF